MKKNKISLIIIIILAIVLVAWLAARGNKHRLNLPPNEFDAKEVTFTDVSESDLPQGMPGNIPMEDNTKVTQNFNAQNKVGKTVGVKEFVSAESLQANYELYKQYLETNGYALVDQIEQPDQKIISGDKDGFRLRVRAYKENGEIKVTVNYVQL